MHARKTLIRSQTLAAAALYLSLSLCISDNAIAVGRPVVEN